MVGPLAYIGGKNRLAKQIIVLFPKHKTYVEAFAGGAQVFFHKEPSEVEVLNDLDREVVNFFRVCQWHHEELLRCLRFSLVSREWFRLQQLTNPEALTDVQRAARFLYLQKTCFGGLIRHRNYKHIVVGRPGFNLDRLPELIEKAHERLHRVQIECLPYEAVLRKFDRSTTLFYLDPPYWGPKLYRFNLAEADFVKLAERLQKVKGKFLLSLNDRPEVRSVFKMFAMREVELHYTVQREAVKRFRELLIANFPLPKSLN